MVPYCRTADGIRRFLELDTRYPWETLPAQPDLMVGGGAIELLLSNARIGHLHVNTTHGRMKTSLLRCVPPPHSMRWCMCIWIIDG